MGIPDRPISPRSPWQNPYAERLIGSLRREFLNHVLIVSERHLRRVLALYSSYYNESSACRVAVAGRRGRSTQKQCPWEEPGGQAPPCDAMPYQWRYLAPLPPAPRRQEKDCSAARGMGSFCS